MNKQKNCYNCQHSDYDCFDNLHLYNTSEYIENIGIDPSTKKKCWEKQLY